MWLLLNLKVIGVIVFYLGEMDGYQGGHLPAQRLAPLKRNSVFDQFSNPQMLGANIQGLKGVPMIYVQTKDMRQLPLPQLDWNR